jgi:hypothetical protein
MKEIATYLNFDEIAARPWNFIRNVGDGTGLRLRHPAHLGPGRGFATGYLGSAVTSQLRAGNRLFGQASSPIYFGAMAWEGPHLSDDCLRAFITKKDENHKGENHVFHH